MIYWPLVRKKANMGIHIRKQMARYARRHGVSAAARHFGTTRVTVRKWRDRYEAEGLRGLADRSRAPKHTPHKTPKATEDRLIELRQRYPRWGFGRLNTHFPLRCSPSAGARILRQAGLTRRQKKKRVRNDLRAEKARLRPFEKLQVDAKELHDIPAYVRYMREEALPKYLYSTRDLRTGAAWFAYARKKNTWTAALFADYVLGHLAMCGIDLSATTVQTDNGVEFVGSASKKHGESSLFEETVRTYTGQLPVTIFPGAKTSQSDVEAFHRLVEDEFLAVEDHRSLRRLLGCSRVYQVYFNHYRRLLWKGAKTPAQLLAQALPDPVHSHLTPLALTLPPIVLEDVEQYLDAPGYDVPVLVTAGSPGHLTSPSSTHTLSAVVSVSEDPGSPRSAGRRRPAYK